MDEAAEERADVEAGGVACSGKEAGVVGVAGEGVDEGGDGEEWRASWPLMPAAEMVADGETIPATEAGRP